MPQIQRIFLDWCDCLPDALADFLYSRFANDMSDLMLIVPTVQAGRRLREALAVRAAADGIGLHAPYVSTAWALVEPEKSQVASEEEVLCALALAVQSASAGIYEVLFPGVKRPVSFEWAVATGRSILDLRRQLMSGGRSLAMVYQEFGEELNEAQRWHALGELEEILLRQLDDWGRSDPLWATFEKVQQPSLPAGVRQILVAALPDLPPIVEKALRRLGEVVNVGVVVHAPVDLSDWFDEFGRPVSENWGQLDLPLEEERVRVFADSSAQIESAFGLLRENDSSVAFGVLDPDITPRLQDGLRQRGFVVLDPTGRPLFAHGIGRLALHFLELTQSDDYGSVAEILRNPDVLAWASKSKDAKVQAQILEELDKFQNYYLPVSLARMRQLLASDNCNSYKLLPNVISNISLANRNLLASENIAAALNDIFKQIFSFTGESQPDSTGANLAAASSLAELLFAFEQNPQMGKLPHSMQVNLLSDRIKQEMFFYPDPEMSRPDMTIDGWLELHWVREPNLVLLGMNDNFVPGATVGHCFMPDSMRSKLAVADNNFIFRRDAYLFSAMLATRRKNGSVTVFLGKTNRNGDVLRPSRLLFLCKDKKLPQRALKLFSQVSSGRGSVVREQPWKLQPKYTENDLPKRISVTVFRDYLACPFRFFLRHMNGARRLSDQKTEFDALDFGTLAHDVLELFGRDLKVRDSESEQEIASFLLDTLSTILNRRFGGSLPVAVVIQEYSLRQRLSAMARIQARERRDGWQIIHTEYNPGGDDGFFINQMKVVGRIDRIERHEDGRLRVLDYKTSDKAEYPEKKHLRKIKDERDLDFAWDDKLVWADLQIPLYVHMLKQLGPVHQCGYFCLPKAITETEILGWPGLNDFYVKSALNAAEKVVECIKNGIFWPPTKMPQHFDEFLPFFSDGLLDSCEFPPVIS